MAIILNIIYNYKIIIEYFGMKPVISLFLLHQALLTADYTVG
jgi:hypothetical protein